MWEKGLVKNQKGIINSPSVMAVYLVVDWEKLIGAHIIL
jgi:hypothetical protein